MFFVILAPLALAAVAFAVPSQRAPAAGSCSRAASCTWRAWRRSGSPRRRRRWAAGSSSTRSARSCCP